MSLLEYLAAIKSGAEPERPVLVEHRLCCSGELFRAGVITADRRKSDICRVLLEEPFQLSVVSTPVDTFPQELCLRFIVGLKTKSKGNVQVVSHFDDEIVRDVCSLLSVLCRRLV